MFDWIKDNLQYFSINDLQVMVEAYKDSDGMSGISQDDFNKLAQLKKA